MWQNINKSDNVQLQGKFEIDLVGTVDGLN